MSTVNDSTFAAITPRLLRIMEANALGSWSPMSDGGIISACVTVRCAR